MHPDCPPSPESLIGNHFQDVALAVNYLDRISFGKGLTRVRAGPPLCPLKQHMAQLPWSNRVNGSAF
jgi:hypothetical protein